MLVTISAPAGDYTKAGKQLRYCNHEGRPKQTRCPTHPQLIPAPARTHHELLGVLHGLVHGGGQRVAPRAALDQRLLLQLLQVLRGPRAGRVGV